VDLQNQTVATGSNASFTVTATGSSPLVYQWQFNGTNIGGATEADFARTNAQPVYAGSYAVVVTNWFGSTTSLTATLTLTNANLDTDGNGLPDSWEQQFFGQTGVNQPELPIRSNKDIF
jgi:hypothetical protein